MKSIVSFAALFFVTWSGLAQAPDWVDETTRKRYYSAESFLTGFATEGKVSGEEKSLTRLKEIAKAELIESIQVTIQSKSELKEQELKGTINQYQQSYLFESTSFSEGDIYGLETKTYYDKKQKRTYAFAYVSKQKLINYYKAIISQGISNNELHFQNATRHTNEGNLASAIEAAFAAGDELKTISKAQSILMALGVTDEQSLRKEQFTKDRTQMAETLGLILRNEKLTSSNLVTYFVKNLNQNFVDTKKTSLYLSSFYFQGFTLTSDLSGALKTYFSSEISKINSLSLASDSLSADYILSGTFTDTEKEVAIHVNMKQRKGNTRKLSGAVSQSSLRKDSIQFLPLPIQKVRLVNSLVLLADRKQVTVKCNEAVNLPYNVVISSPKNSVNKIKLSEIPLLFRLNKDTQPARLLSNDQGEANFTLVSVRSPMKKQYLYSTIDLGTYLQLDTTSADFKKIKREATPPKTVLDITVTGNVLYCVSQERNLGKDLTSSYLREGIVDALSKTGFEFTKDASRADYVLTIKSDTRAGSTFDDLYFSYLDATISLVDRSKKTEVFANQYRDLKGAGSNYEGAGIKAYSTSVKKIQGDLTSYFLK